MIVIGVDPHKRSHTATAVDPSTNRDLGSLRVPASAAGYAQLSEWAAQWPDRLWAIENAKGLGRHLAQWLIRIDGAHVVDVPPTATARVRELSRGGRRKNDRIDAAAAACVAFTQGDYRRVEAEDITDEMRVLVERRSDVMVHYRRLINQLHALAREMIAGGVPTTRAVERIVTQIRCHRPISPTDQARHDVAMDIVGDLRRAKFQIDDLTERLAATVERSQTRLTETRGFGPVTTAIVLARVGDPSRFRSEAAFAAFRNHTHRSRQRRQLPPPTLPSGRPTTQLSPALRCTESTTKAWLRRPALLPTQSRRRQNTPRSDPLPQTPNLQTGLANHQYRPQIAT